MQANPRTIDMLFNAQLRFVVPMFQRLYVWQETPQWTTLWEDVAEKATLQIEGTASTPHYLGALIIEGVRPNSPREVKRFLVIDGQQRLTTLQLLLCAFRDLARSKEWKSLDRTTTRYLENTDKDVMERPDEELLKLWPTTLNRDVFRDILLAGEKQKIEAQFPLIYLPKKRKPELRSNLVEGYLYFYRSIEKWIASESSRFEKSGEHCAFSLLQSLQQDFCVVEIALSEGDDSQEIFYSLNSQGRPLSQSDLLRSLIFMRAEKERQNRDQIFEEYWSKFETPFWSSEVKRAGRTSSRLDIGLRYFLTSKMGRLVDTRRVNEEYRHWISTPPLPYKTVRDELADLARHCAAYQRFDSAPVRELPSTDLRRVLLDFDISTAMPLILFLELDAGLGETELGQCLFALECFLARRVFTNEENKEYNKLFVEILGGLRGVDPSAILPALCKKLLSGGGSTRKWPSRSEVVEHAISKPVFGEIATPALRLILERLELAQRGKKSEGIDIPSGLQIEHVLPQTWATHWPLRNVTIPAHVALHPFLATEELTDFGEAIRVRNSQLQTLGNLTLLNKYLNPAASNGSFDMKRVEYGNSVLRLNRYFDSVKTWNEEEIVARGALLGDLICKVWPRPDEN